MQTKKSPLPKGNRHGGENKNPYGNNSIPDDLSQPELIVDRGGFPYQILERNVRLNRRGDLVVGLTIRGWCAEPGCGQPFEFKLRDGRWFDSPYQRRRCGKHKRPGVVATPRRAER